MGGRIGDCRPSWDPSARLTRGALAALTVFPALLRPICDRVEAKEAAIVPQIAAKVCDVGDRKGGARSLHLHARLQLHRADERIQGASRGFVRLG